MARTSLHHSNLLRNTASPYLRQHAGNPVHWRPWSEEIFSEADTLDRPILLSIGYAACHWCHVMARESFENPQIADLMNRHFINVKVDREERPEIDQIYMEALQAMGQHGGWPLTMFLDPQGRPFWGGTYFPPVARHGIPAFPEILAAIAKAWAEERPKLLTNGAALDAYLRKNAEPPDRIQEAKRSDFHQYCDSLLRIYDPVNGGLGPAPKFPSAPMTETLLRRSRHPEGETFRKAFLHTMRQMCRGGIYDQIGGGLARYSVDETWLVPHFEKMLYDNASFLRQACSAYMLSGDALFRNRIEQTIAWLTREMRLEGGAFAASLDADSEGEEGKYYLWTKDEVDTALGPDSPQFCAAYGISEQGNFEGRNILNLLHNKRNISEIDQEFERQRQKLLEIRNARPAPAQDDKILADWNGYAIRAIAECGFALARPDWVEIASAAFRFITESMDDGGLAHSFRNGQAVRPALASDLSAMALAAFSLYQVTAEKPYLDHAINWIENLQRSYSDGTGGYYLTRDDAKSVPIRVRCDRDDPNPSPASQILETFVKASVFLDHAYLEHAEKLARNLSASLAQRKYGLSGFYNSVDYLWQQRHIEIFADSDSKLGMFLDVLRQVPDPNLTFRFQSETKNPQYRNQVIRPQISPCAVLCEGNSCSEPIRTPEKLLESIEK